MQKILTRWKNSKWVRNSFPFWLILPTIIALLIVQVYPAFYTIWLSFQERSPDGWEFVGAKNFERLFAMSIFNESIGHTIIYLVGYVGLTLIIGFFIAFLLSKKIKFSGGYITLLFIPWVIAQIIVGLVFRLLVVPNYGLLSGIFGNPELFPPDGLSVLTAVRPAPWFGDFPFPPSPAMIFLILASTWRALPFVMLLLLAAIQTIPTQVIESSRIDGANAWQRIRYIMLPLIMPTLVVAIFSLTLSGINGVGMVFSLTGGGPGTNTQVLSYLLYTIGWGQLRFGRAAALALLMAAINWVLITGTMRITKTGTGEEDVR
ncbi:MAG: sugar ABC transporter permease [Anaerolineae bacterium]|jgi:ABC-type sugar transport system permease subunit|nr:sugar ABC transporter permease [Anaerolineae bacterium]MBT4310316.1 sugar ABC transporter permease [Anaerolineae bacterium]MBT4459830.1 sugar ABC transporter permease [Anaerolineae bacterium]MBT6060680.1 sugar ABC transporter permease [Anaerolineae bacterium]MBT6321218.1 sugar ABC transporter permease [Anaerolineae bacterium]